MSDTQAALLAEKQNTNIGRVIMISLVATLGGFLFGFDSGVINGTTDGIADAFGSNAAVTGFNVASMLLGCAVGAFFAGRLADVFGRRTMLFVAAVFFLISAWGSGIAGTTPTFVFYRILGGLAVGAASVMAPAYIAEIAPARIRGALATAQQIAIVAGLAIAFSSNYFLAKFAGGSTAEFWMGFSTWRWMFWMEIIPAAVFLIALFGIPESPRFLVAKGRTKDAQDVLTKLYGAGAALTKTGEIQASLANDHAPSFRDIFVGGKVRPIIWIGIGLATFQQLVGINVFFYYGAVLWQAIGFPESEALLTNVIMALLGIPASLICLSFVDKIGRKPFLLFGSIGMALALGVMAVLFNMGELVADAAGKETLVLPSSTISTLALVVGLAYAFIFNMTWGPVMWVALGEMFPNQIRGSGLAIAGLAQWGSNFLVTLTFPIMLVSIGLAASYGVYAAFAALSAVFIIYVVRETMGVELEDMQG